MGAYHRTSDGQEHKIIWPAGLERGKAVIVKISLGSFTEAGDFRLQLIRLESLGSELTTDLTTFTAS